MKQKFPIWKILALTLSILIFIGIVFDRRMPIYPWTFKGPIGRVLAQVGVDLTCPVGQRSLDSMDTRNPNTGNIRHNVCIDSNGVMTFQGVAGGGITSVASTTYTFSVLAGTVTATPNLSSLATFSGTDGAVVINSALNATSSTGGTYYFKDGIYNLNSATSVTMDIGAGFCLICIPAPPSATQHVQYHFIGESTPVFFGGAVQTQGVILNETAAARISAGAGNVIAVLFEKQDAANVGNDVDFRRIGCRIVDNQRGNEDCFKMYEALTTNFDETMVDLGTGFGTPALPTISPAVKGVTENIAYQTTKNSKNNWQNFNKTIAVGFDNCYDVESEHSNMYAATAALCNNFGFYGRILGATALTHPGVWTKVTDQSNINGLTFGVGMQWGSQFLADFDIEACIAGNCTNSSWNRVADFTETNAGFTAGQINYEYIRIGGTPIAEVNSGRLFPAGQGVNISQISSQIPYPYSPIAGFDSMTHPNGIFLGGWIPCNGCSPNGLFTISSNVAVGTAAGASAQWAHTASNADQFSKITINNVTAGGVGVTVRSNANSNASQTEYRYFCTNAARSIIKRVANVNTTEDTAAVACVNGHTMELRAVGQATTCLFAYDNGVLDKNLPLGGVFCDSSSPILTGFPGILAFSATDSLTNWSGGSLSLFDSARSDYSVGAIHPTYGTIGNCNSSASPAVCGSSASGMFTLPAAATSVTVNTTAVTANSIIIVFNDDSLGTRLGVTCNTGIDNVLVSARVAGTSFTVTGSAPVTNPNCYSYMIIN